MTVNESVKCGGALALPAPRSEPPLLKINAQHLLNLSGICQLCLGSLSV